MRQFDPDNLNVIQELMSLIARTEILVEGLGRMIPPDKSWLRWRQKALQRRLEDAKREAKALIEQVQVLLLKQSVEARHSSHA